MIKIRKLTKYFSDKLILDDIDLDIPNESIYGIIGYSGAGKSTLLKILNALEAPSSGEVFIDGVDLYSLSKNEIKREQAKIGMIFQNFNLLESKNVFDNIALPLRLAKEDKKEIEKKVNDIINFVGLENFVDKYPHQLSGGQKQRVGIARALVNDPQILLCDEATSALDPETTKQILDLLKKVNKELKITIVLITHQMEVIKSICARVAVLEKGKLVEENDIFNLFSNPKENITKKFVESILFQEMPPSVVKHLKDASLYRLTFNNNHVEEAILSTISIETGFHFSILQGVITEIKDQSFGQLIIKPQEGTILSNEVLEKFNHYNVKVTEIRKEQL